MQLRSCVCAQVVVDLSQAASIADMRGTRVAALSNVVQRFITDFFAQNPLSHLSVMLMRDGVAEALTDLSGSPVSVAWLLAAVAISLPAQQCRQGHCRSMCSAASCFVHAKCCCCSHAADLAKPALTRHLLHH